jgi:hypothetical protein
MGRKEGRQAVRQEASLCACVLMPPAASQRSPKTPINASSTQTPITHNHEAHAGGFLAA